MNKNFTIAVTMLLFCTSSFGQDPIDVTDQTIKIKGFKEEELYFGFAEGDKLIFNFQVLDDKELKEIEIIEYPNTSKFSDYKTRKIENKVITINKKGVYIFRFKNSAITGRICKIDIKRVAANESTKNFNSTVIWENKQETTYNSYTKDVIVGYDTTYIQKSKKEITKSEQNEDMIVDKTERVHSINNLDNKNFKVIQVNLPQEELSEYKTKKIKSWAYWIGVGKEASDSWRRNVSTFRRATTGAFSILGGSPLAGLAVGAISDLAMPTMGEDVAYWFITDYSNAQSFLASRPFMQFDKGKGIAAFGKNTDKRQGTFYIGLLNDNQFQGIDANVKISIVWETNYYQDKQYTEMNVTPRYEKKQYTDPIIKTVRVPVTGY
jgi:hypothetical protein